MKALKLIAGLIPLALAACSSSTPAATPGAPTITITSPAAGAMVTAGSDAMKSVPVAFTLTNFTLAAPSATNATGVGHIHVLVDGAACTPSGAPYDNADTDKSPAEAFLSTCATDAGGSVKGAHTITLELHNNDHSPVNDASGKVISAQVSITAS